MGTVSRAERIRAATRIAAAQFAEALADVMIEALGEEEPANEITKIRGRMVRPQNQPSNFDEEKAKKFLRQAGFSETGRKAK